MGRNLDDTVRDMRLAGTQHGILGINGCSFSDRSHHERRVLGNEATESRGCAVILIGICQLNEKNKRDPFSENGMKAVNTLLLLAMLFYRSGLLFVAYIVWICYLVFCIRNTESRGSKVVYSVFVGLAVVMIGVSLYGLIRG